MAWVPVVHVTATLVTLVVAGVVAVGSFGELHEGKPPRPASLPIDRQHDLRRRRDAAEIRTQVCFGGAVRQIADEQTDGQSTLP